MAKNVKNIIVFYKVTEDILHSVDTTFFTVVGGTRSMEVCSQGWDHKKSVQ